MIRQAAFAALITGILFSQVSAAATYTLSVEPSYTPERAVEVYRPLLSYLKKVTGHDFVLKTTKNYHSYWSDLRGDKLGDFVFDDAHFTDYRSERYGYVPLVKTLASASYKLVSQNDVPDNDPQQLVGKSIMSMPAPSMGFAFLIELFPNPMQQPDIRSTASSWLDCIEQVFSGDAEAAMVPSYIADLYPNLLVVSSSREMPGAAVSASSKVPADVQAAVLEALLAIHEDEDAFAATSELGITQFVPASASDFVGSEQILRGFFGYKSKQ